ncbi:hypothetical protein [Anaerobaca lacustris]|uniref:Uncharacterized protein n=1 Tax=Anaerobaca lacustris TaxID=3044600 RepID=A0AAW6TRU0_9BACT|nr:hypothetical protein [Sedimentisphaerales bacterium M17dextr]
MALPVEVGRLIETFKRNAIQHQIDATDAQIERPAYELYGLTDEEIRIVEEGEACNTFAHLAVR